jgi:mono/diheme cytochrome c family protein
MEVLDAGSGARYLHLIQINAGGAETGFLEREQPSKYDKGQVMLHRDRTGPMSVVPLLMLLAAPAASAETAVQRGQVIARGLCSQCHAIGRTDESKHPAAPRFRILDTQTDLSKLSQRIREGLLTGHEDMPMFRFNRADADAMVAYIRSVQSP